MKEILWETIEKIRVQKPIIHCINNPVTMSDCANIISYIGASPIMARHIKEIEDICNINNSIVLNLGATEFFDSMIKALTFLKKEKKSIPITIDPTGVASSNFRREQFYKIVDLNKPSCIRANASEAESILKNKNLACGVDVSRVYSLREKLELAKDISKKFDTIVVITGEEDVIAKDNKFYVVRNGIQEMGTISGTGCMLSALIGTILSVENSIESILAISCFYKISGKLAKEEDVTSGLHYLKNAIMNNISKLNKEEFIKYISF